MRLGTFKLKTMYNCWNEALAWLEKQPKMKMVGDKLLDKRSDDVKLVETLMNQYYYGIQAKKELYEVLVELNIITLN